MKRTTITLFCIALLAWSLPGHAAMSLSEVRQNARFLSDRMAHELSLNTAQYTDVYEINYDFLASIRTVMDGVVDGNDAAIDRYYEYLDMRNEDLSYVLTRTQYMRFAEKDYFYRPVCTDRHSWQLRIYGVYSNVGYFYFSLPVNFYTYSGLHSRSRYHRSFYHGRYRHERYHGLLLHIRDNGRYADHRRHDFGAPPPPDRRPSRYDSSRRPGRYDRNPMPPHRPEGGVHRPDNGRPAPSGRPERPGGHNTTVRPNQGNHSGSQVRPNRPEGHNQGSRPNQGKRPDKGNGGNGAGSQQQGNNAAGRNHGASRR